MFPSYQYFIFNRSITVVVPESDFTTEKWEVLNDFMRPIGARRMDQMHDFEDGTMEPCMFNYSTLDPDSLDRELVYAGMTRIHINYGLGFFDGNDMVAADQATSVHLSIGLSSNKHVAPDDIHVVDEYLQRRFVFDCVRGDAKMTYSFKTVKDEDELKVAVDEDDDEQMTLDEFKAALENVGMRYDGNLASYPDGSHMKEHMEKLNFMNMYSEVVQSPNGAVNVNYWIKMKDDETADTVEGENRYIISFEIPAGEYDPKKKYVKYRDPYQKLLGEMSLENFLANGIPAEWELFYEEPKDEDDDDEDDDQSAGSFNPFSQPVPFATGADLKAALSEIPDDAVIMITLPDQNGSGQVMNAEELKDYVENGDIWQVFVQGKRV